MSTLSVPLVRECLQLGGKLLEVHLLLSAGRDRFAGLAPRSSSQGLCAAAVIRLSIARSDAGRRGDGAVGQIKYVRDVACRVDPLGPRVAGRKPRGWHSVYRGADCLWWRGFDTAFRERDRFFPRAPRCLPRRRRPYAAPPASHADRPPRASPRCRQRSQRPL